MYKLKLSKGEVLEVNDSRRSGVVGKFIGGYEYSQIELEQLYNTGFKKYVKKTKDEKSINTDTTDTIQLSERNEASYTTTTNILYVR